MDLYSAARRFSRPFEIRERISEWCPPIGAHGAIGDGFTCALVRPDGAIDWLCLPRFDSPSVFAGLLDPNRGGMTAVTPRRRPFESLQRYDPDTNVLETLFRIPDQGVVRLTDFMPWTNDPRAAIHEVHRRIECREGAADLEALFDPRFDYGRDPGELELGEHGALARSRSGETLACVLSNGERFTRSEGGGVHSHFRLQAGQFRWMVLSWGAPQPEPVTAYRPFDQLRQTRHAWREWSRLLHYDGPWRHHVLRSALALKLLIYQPSGAMVAAPTTSLPEWPGGTRNWDYRYAWTRDAALGIGAANRIGYSREATEFFHFVRDTLDQRHSLEVVYRVDGQPVHEESELGHLAGYAGSVPVRIGNEARGQRQLDTAGALVNAAFTYASFGGSLTLRAWRHLRDVVEAVCQSWSKPDHGLWEVRDEPRHNVHSKLMSWVALDRARRLAPLFGDQARIATWSCEADRIREQILTHGLDPSGRHFVSTLGGTEPDASLLLLPIHGLLSPSNERVQATIDWVRGELGCGPFLRRYRSEDGVGGPEGAFVLCGFWLAEVLALAGRLDEAQEIFVAHAEASNHVGLLAEELDPSSGALLGNFPQAFSHLGLINAATRIDRGLRRRDEGTPTGLRFIVDS
ncbi:MAG: glycoside hydrolase family 15 protein [Myxococcota bacterium]